MSEIPYSLAPLATALVSGVSTIPLSPSHNGAAIQTAIGSIPTADSVSGLVIGTQTLIPGGPARTVNSVLYSLAPSATALVSGSITIPLVSSPTGALPAITIAGTTYTANSASQYIIGTQTLIGGAPGITIGRVPYSLAPSATALVSRSVTIPLASGPSRTPPPITIGGTTYTANSASQYFIGTQTLVPNSGPITINSAPYALSIGPSATALIVGTSTSSLTATPNTNPSANTTDHPHAYTIDGQTLSPGSEITVSGTKVSLGPQGTDVVVGSSTEAVGLGGVILSGFGAGPTEPAGNATTGVVGFTGGASGMRIPREWSIYGILMFGLMVSFRL